MINFEEQLKKFHPSLEVEDAEEAIYNQDLTDMADILVKMINDISMEAYNSQQAAQRQAYSQQAAQREYGGGQQAAQTEYGGSQPAQRETHNGQQTAHKESPVKSEEDSREE